MKYDTPLNAHALLSSLELTSLVGYSMPHTSAFFIDMD